MCVYVYVYIYIYTSVIPSTNLLVLIYQIHEFF